MKKLLLILSIAIPMAGAAKSPLPVLWEELTAPDFAKAVELSGGVCVIPLGVMEKHGTHLPLGTDVYQAGYVGKAAAEQEYCVVFPSIFAGVIDEAKHQPGTIAYSPELLYKIFDETCSEIARNGMDKIIIYNMHGGNPNFLKWFSGTRLSKPLPYTLYLVEQSYDAQTLEKINKMKKSPFDSHGGEIETSVMLVITPGLVDMEAVNDEPGHELHRLQPKSVSTAIQWYSSFPNHYAGDASEANTELGQFILDYKIEELTEAIRWVKQDEATPELLRQFYREGERPLDTPVYR